MFGFDEEEDVRLTGDQEKKINGKSRSPFRMEVDLMLDKSDTLIMIDWDDTLAWTHGLANSSSSHLKSTDHARLLKKLEQAAIQLLEVAKQLGTVAIVTNSQDGWVRESAEKWMPNILPVLEGVTILSARHMFEGKTNWYLTRFSNALPEHPLLRPTTKEEPKSTSGGSVSLETQIQWKFLAFLTLLFREQSLRYPSYAALFQTPPKPLTLVSIGDSIVERHAIHRVDQLKLNNLAPIKSIKLCTDPSAEELLSELEEISATLGNIINLARHVDLNLCRKNEKSE